jgi:hypothetical protein
MLLPAPAPDPAIPGSAPPPAAPPPPPPPSPLCARANVEAKAMLAANAIVVSFICFLQIPTTKKVRTDGFVPVYIFDY